MESIPGIGPGPIAQDEFEQRAQRYLDRGWPAEDLPLTVVTDGGVYELVTAGQDVSGAASGGSSPGSPDAAQSTEEV